MKIDTWKRTLAVVAFCSMGVWEANAVWWKPPVEPPEVAYWDEDANWDGGLPLGDTKTQFTSSRETECVVTNAVVAGQIVMGDGGTEGQKVTVRIADGGVLNGCYTGGGWTGVGYNREAHCIVESGGALTNGNRLGVGMVTGGIGFFEVSGSVSLAGVLQVANGGDKGTVMLYDGGSIAATGLEMGDNGVIDIWQSGTLTLSGNLTNAVSGFIADEKIIGNRLTNNLDVVLNEVSPGVTNTVINATPSIPNIAGLTQAEAEAMILQFGYTVGTVTEGSAPGGITGLVAASVPEAGSTPGAPGSPINIIIQEAGQVPDLIGLDYDVATNVIVQSGYVVGIETEVYEFDNIPGLVTTQSPPAFVETGLGSPVDITFNERLASATTTVATATGYWNEDSMWSVGVAPARETQNYEVQLRGGASLTLTNWVALRRIHQGHNGSPGIAQLNVMDGGHLIAGLYNDYAAVGWNAPAELNVYAGGIYESREALRVAWLADGSNTTINIDGGSVIAAGWLSLGSAGVSSSEITITNGGSLFCDYINTGRKNGVITMYDGTFTTSGTGLGGITDALADGTIIVADGYEQSLDVINGDAVLTVFLPGYEAWAGLWGVDIGGEMEDYDNDLRENLYEYALNGDPTDDQDPGQEPVFVNNGSGFEYNHLVRKDDTNLVYTVQTRESLTTGDWMDTGSTLGGMDVTGGDYNVQTNIIWTVNDQSFIRLKVANP